MKNKKGAVGGDLIVLVGKIALLLVAIVVVIIFITAFMPIAVGKAAAGQCKWSLDIIASWNNDVKDVKNKAQTEISNNAPTLVVGEGLAGCGAGAGVGAIIGSVVPVLGTAIGAGFGCAVGGIVGVVHARTIVNSAHTATGAFFDSLKMTVDTCLKETPVTCKGDAAYVGKCIYKYASTTWYTLRGGQEYSKKNFNMFKIDAEITKLGTLEMYTGCDNYVVHPNDNTKKTTKLSWIEIDSNTYYSRNNYPYGMACNITTSVVDERVMTLAMIEECQKKGPSDTDCKCYVKSALGYNSDNGLPNVGVTGDDSKTNELVLYLDGSSCTTKDNDNNCILKWADDAQVYDTSSFSGSSSGVAISSGCGDWYTSPEDYKPTEDAGFPKIMYESGNWKELNLIKWMSNWVNWEEGKKTLYTRVMGTGDGEYVCISSNADTSTCD